VSYGHPDPDTSPRPEPRRPLTRRRAYDVAIAFGLATGMACTPKLASEGGCWDARVPMEYLEGLLEALGKLEPEP